MLEKYRPYLKELSEDEVVIVRELMQLESKPKTGEELFDLCHSLELTQADLVVALLPNGSTVIRNIIEKLTGKPITIISEQVIDQVRSILPVNVDRIKTGDTRTIHMIVINPKKMGSDAYRRFGLYTEGMTVQDYYNAGGKRSDINWDSKHGFIQFKYPKIEDSA